MEKEKIYIFVIPNLDLKYGGGGAEMYTMGKSRYLHDLGWKVFVYTSTTKSQSTFPDLRNYVIPVEGCRFLSVPPYKLPLYQQDFYLALMIQKLQLVDREDYWSDLKEYDIIVESISAPVSYWAELLAARIGARHFVNSVEEHYRYPVSRHEENLDFFYFKWKRNELITNKNKIKALFNGYKNVTDTLVEFPYQTREQDAVQDVEAPRISQIEKLDWNICHIGRASKNYVPHFIEGVAELARRYPDKKINVIFVGTVKYITELLNRRFNGLSNINMILLGNLFPIPRVLFSKVDVVCAISQAARFAANEDVFTVVASAKHTDKTPGVLGYDTDEQVNGEPTFTYFEALENVLAKKIYDDKESTLPKLEPAEVFYERFWTILKNADPSKEYFVERFRQNRIRHFAAVFPFDSIARGSRIILFGATEIASDYRRQIEAQYLRGRKDFGNFGTTFNNQENSHIEIGPDGIKNVPNEPYCHILATVDPHPENFDDSVVGFERLETIDYDAIVITTYSGYAEEAREIILSIVPQMKDRIICDLYFFEVYWEYKEKKPEYLDF